MLTPQIFYSVLLMCCAYAAFRGAGPEKIAAAIMLVAAILSTALLSPGAIRFQSVELGIFAVDVVTLVAMLILALRAERIWLLWLAAAQLIGTAGHAIKIADPEISRGAYAFALSFWSYPMITMLVIGTFHHRKRLARWGEDRSWSSTRSKSGR